MDLPTDPDTLLTGAEFAKVLKCGKTTFKQMEDAGLLPDPCVWAGKQPRWSAGVVRAWIRCGGLKRALPKPPNFAERPEVLPNSTEAEEDASQRKKRV